jgi:predicted dinucleotide-binding enzyme
MRIGIIGVGNMGKALGKAWCVAGHEVLFGSGDLDKAKAFAASVPGVARGGTFDEAAMFGEVALYTIRDRLPSQVLRSPATLAGKVVIDCNNTVILGLDQPRPDGRPGIQFINADKSLAEHIAADVPGAKVVKAFNTMASGVIERGRDALLPHRVSVFVCADDPQARNTVGQLAEEIGFVAIDSGGLEYCRLVECAGDFIRFQILPQGMGLGGGATISVNVLPPE